MKISNETKVGVIAACAITILILGFNFLKGETLFSKNNTYYAVYDKVDGLFRSNPVVFHGVTVGSVSSVEMDYASRQVVVSVNVPKDLQIPRNSILKITNNDLLGSKAIEIIFPPDSLALPQFAASGDTLESKKDAGMAQALTSVLSPLSESISHVLGNVDTAIANISLKSTLQDLSEALASFKNTASKLNTILDGKDEQLTSILGNIDGMTKDLKATTPKITSMVSSLDETSKNVAALDLQSLTTELTGTISEMNKTLSAIQAGEGSLGKLATNDDLWNNLNRSTHDIDSLIKDIIKYPRRYTGITEKQRKKGDEQKEVEEGIQLPDGKD